MLKKRNRNIERRDKRARITREREQGGVKHKIVKKKFSLLGYDVPIAILAQPRSLIRHKEEPGLNEGEAKIFNCSSPDITPLGIVIPSGAALFFISPVAG